MIHPFTAFASAIIAGQGLLLIGVLLSIGRDRPLANALLATLIAAVAARIGVYHLLAQGVSNPTLLGLFSQAFFLGGPLLYLYTRALLEPTSRLRLRDTLHFLPAFASAVATPWLYDPYSFSETYPADTALQQLHTIDKHKLVAVGVFVVYVAFALHRVRASGDIEGAANRWLRRLLSPSLLGAAVLVLALWCSRMVLGPPIGGLLAEAIEFGSYALLFYFIATVGVRGHLRLDTHKVQIAPESPHDMPAPAGSIESTETATRGRYQRTSLTQARAQQLWKQVNRYMESDEPYLNCDLNLADLATAIDSYPRELSQVLNTIGEQNFYDFVNRYRATKARDLIRTQPHIAMIDIALAAGFNGRSTLYKHFVRCFEMTPSQFRKTCKTS